MAASLAERTGPTDGRSPAVNPRVGEFLLEIAFKTVVCHRYGVQEKLKAHNTAELTKAALRMGLIEL